MLAQCRGVIFDCDGVLVDSEYLCHVALAEALLALGLNEDPGRLYRAYSGWPLSTIFAELETCHGVRLPGGFEVDYRRIVARLFEAELEPVPGAAALLQNLKLPFCVASNGPRHKIEHSLGLCGLLEYFEGRIFSAYEVGAWKPDPGLFLAASAGLGLLPEQCLVVEDSRVGVRAAQEAGIPVLLYTGGREIAAPPAPLLQYLGDLPALLEVPTR